MSSKLEEPEGLFESGVEGPCDETGSKSMVEMQRCLIRDDATHLHPGRQHASFADTQTSPSSLAQPTSCSQAADPQAFCC